jgi:SAM-dependent methyltransferase
MIAPADLQRIYTARFEAEAEYRNRVWRVLVGEFFQKFIPPDGCVLDLGCGYGQFINHVRCQEKYAIDLNLQAAACVASDVKLLAQDSAQCWPVPDESLDIVFSSNFFEHLPHKGALEGTVKEIRRCLKPGGRLIAMGPNIRFVGGAYWDFWDHYLPLTERSLEELLLTRKFHMERVTPRFLPYTMVGKKPKPTFLLSAYLKMPWAWRFFGQQFLVVAQRRDP